MKIKWIKDKHIHLNLNVLNQARFMCHRLCDTQVGLTHYVPDLHIYGTQI